MGPSGNHLPVGLTGGSDLLLLVLSPPPRSLASLPRSVTQSALRPHTLQTPPPVIGCGDLSRGLDPGDPGDLGPSVRHRKGRHQELFHPATPGKYRARPVGHLPMLASNSASKNETTTSRSRESPHGARTSNMTPLFHAGSLSRGPGPQCGVEV